jgi:hypothetical protein
MFVSTGVTDQVRSGTTPSWPASSGDDAISVSGEECSTVGLTTQPTRYAVELPEVAGDDRCEAPPGDAC